VPLQRRGCLVAPWFLWIVLVPVRVISPATGMESEGWIWQSEHRDRLGLTPDLTTRWATGKDNFVYSSLWDCKSSFTCRKILRHGTFPLYFPSERKECCGFLLPLKIHRLGRVFNPQPLGPVASTLTLHHQGDYLKCFNMCNFTKFTSVKLKGNLNPNNSFIPPALQLIYLSTTKVSNIREVSLNVISDW
jgi:hypothetical protein